jgi:hypothetical protein
MTGACPFEARAALPYASLDEVIGGGLVVIAPHPDDQTLGCGGLLAAACSTHRKIEIVIVGDKDHPHFA